MMVWMAQAAPLREASIVKKMNERSLLLSSSKITHYFKKMVECKWYFEKILLPLQKIDASNRSS